MPYDYHLLWIGILLVLVIVLVALMRNPRSQAPVLVATPQPNVAVIPTDISLHAQPLLSEAEAFLYNLLRLAVQDRYHVFAQVPLWCLVDVRARGPNGAKTRSAFLSKIALKRADFVLVHPGTLDIAKVVEIQDRGQPTPQRDERNRLMDAVCHAADLELVRLESQVSYTVPTLAALLGLDPDDE